MVLFVSHALSIMCRQEKSCLADHFCPCDRVGCKDGGVTKYELFHRLTEQKLLKFSDSHRDVNFNYPKIVAVTSKLWT